MEIKLLDMEGELDSLNIIDYNDIVVDIINSFNDEYILALGFAKVTYINSTTVGYIIDWSNKLKKKGSRLAIIGAHGSSMNTFKMVGLTDIIKFHENIEDINK